MDTTTSKGTGSFNRPPRSILLEAKAAGQCLWRAWTVSPRDGGLDVVILAVVSRSEIHFIRADAGDSIGRSAHRGFGLGRRKDT
jgi:hypothetical protein